MGIFCFIRQKRGVATLEFALLFLPFFVLLATIIETLILIYQLSSLEYTLTQAARFSSASLPSQGYETRFRQYFDEQSPRFLSFLQPQDLELSIEFCRSLGELENATCSGNNLENKFIIYSLNVKISPLFGIIRLLMGTESFTSKVIYYAERNEYVPTPNP